MGQSFPRLRCSIVHNLRTALTLRVLWVLLAIAVGFGVSPGWAQTASPYDMRWGPGLATVGIGGVTFALGKRASARMDLLTLAEIEALDANDVLRVDRFATRQRSAFAKTVSDVTGYGSTLLPLALLAGADVRDDADDLGLIYAQVAFLNNGLTALAKNTVRRTRPFVYQRDAPLARKRNKDARRSFFSGHTSNAAANAFLTARAYSDFYPEARARPWVWTGAIVLPAVTGATRVLAGKHYWTDVLVGYAVGAGVGLLVPALHRR